MLRLLDTRRPRLLLILFCLLLWTPGFFTLPPGDRDESRFAQATKQMLETGDFVRIQNGTEARNRKPIGIHWLQAPFAAAARATGIASGNPIWPYRIPSALGALASVLATFSIGELLFGRRAALLGAAMLAASVILTVEAHIAKTDAALVGSITVAMAVLARAYVARGTVGAGRAAVFWLAMAVSVLLKGPIGPMVAGLTSASLVVLDRRGGWLRALRPAWGLPLMLAAVLPWFVAIGLATHGQFFAEAIGGDLGRKLNSGDDAHWGPPGLHLLLLPVLLLPAAAALPGALRQAWRDRARPATRLLLAWIVPSWVVFEAAPTKLPHYTLPLYPALCLLAAAWLLALERTPIRRWAAATPMVVAVLLGGTLLALPVLLGDQVWLGVPGALAGLAIAASFTPVLRRPHGEEQERWSMLVALAAMPVLYWAGLQFELPRLQQLWIAPRVAAIVPPGPFGAVGFAEPSLMFLAGTRTRWLLPAEAARELASGEVRSLLVARRELPAVESAALKAGLQPKTVASVTGYNYSRGSSVTVLLLTPGSDLSLR